ncbi:MAG: hypothetical protein R3E96_15895 [Planctomycetota bacterium]
MLVCALALPPLLAWIAHDLLAGSLATGAQKPGPVFWSRQGLAAAFYLAAACLAWVPGTWLPRTLRGPGFVLAWAWLLVLLGLVGSLEIPGAAFPAGLPALGLTAGLALTPVRFWTLVSGFVSLLCLVIWVPLHGALLDAFGFDGAPQVLAPLALTGAGVLPALWTLMRPARTVCAVGAVLTLLLVAGLLHTSGPYTSGRPAKLNVVLSGSALEPQVQIPWPAGIEHRARPEFSELQQWWQADADSAPSAMQWQWLPDPEPGVRRARVTMARGDQALFFEAQETEWIRIAGVQSQPGHGGVWILGAGVEPFELDLPLEPGRQEVHFDCAVGGLPAGLAEWYGALDLPVVPRHRGHEWHVRMQVGLPEVREPDPAVDSK